MYPLRKLRENISQLLSIPILNTSGLHTAFLLLRLTQAWLRRLPFSHTTESRKSSLRDSNHMRMRRCSISCFSTQRRGGGEDIAYKLQKDVDLLNASPGVFVFNNGKFAEQGGFLGVDYFSRSSLRMAIRVKLINSNWGKKPNQRSVTSEIIRENSNNLGKCFIPWPRGGWIAGYEKTGTLIKFNGYMYARSPNGGDTRVYPSEEI